MKTTVKAQKIYELYKQLDELSNGDVSVMVHRIPELDTLNKDWEVEPMHITNGRRVCFTASREGITLFSAEEIRFGAKNAEEN